jgi:hypothetical protein
MKRDRREVSRFEAVSVLDSNRRFVVIEWNIGFVFPRIRGTQQRHPGSREWTLADGSSVVCRDDAEEMFQIFQTDEIIQKVA